MIARFAAAAMGTRFELALEGSDEVRLRAISEEAFEELRALEAHWTGFGEASLVAKVNRLAAERPVALDEETYALLDEALSVARASRGAFDPTLGALMARHGFRGDADAGAPVAWGYEHVHLDADARTVTFDRPGLRLDLGAIAKGRALDLLAELLREHGVERALLHGGTSAVVALGAPTGADAWLVALGPEPDAPRARLAGRALAVSASRGRVSEAGGHVLDASRGAPAPAATACVLAPTAAGADAWATALCAQPDLELPPALSALHRADAPEAADAPWRPLGAPTNDFLHPALQRELPA